jgi:hypothetical protein
MRRGGSVVSGVGVFPRLLQQTGVDVAFDGIDRVLPRLLTSQ